MADPSATFDDHLPSWRAWQASPWGRLRYRVVAHTLERSLAAHGQGPFRVLDVGGGDGVDAIGLARAGHEVTVVDFSAPLLAAAREAARQAGLSDRLSTIQADLEAAGSIAGRPYDVVLCHNVLQYRADPVGAVAQLVELAKPGGLLSLIATNPASDVLAAAVRRLDPAEALALLDAPTARTAVFDHDVRRIAASAIQEALQANGCEVRERFGIRCIADLIADDDRKADPRFSALLERLELAVCDREPFLHTARMWQLVAVRR